MTLPTDLIDVKIDGLTYQFSPTTKRLFAPQAFIDEMKVIKQEDFALNAAQQRLINQMLNASQAKQLDFQARAAVVWGRISKAADTMVKEGHGFPHGKDLNLNHDTGEITVLPVNQGAAGQQQPPNQPLVN